MNHLSCNVKGVSNAQAAVFVAQETISNCFDNLKHEQVMQVVKAFPGRWKKEPNGSTIHYSNHAPQHQQDSRALRDRAALLRRRATSGGICATCAGVRGE